MRDHRDLSDVLDDLEAVNKTTSFWNYLKNKAIMASIMAELRLLNSRYYARIQYIRDINNLRKRRTKCKQELERLEILIPKGVLQNINDEEDFTEWL